MVERTRLNIVQAFERLIERKNFQNITVDDICQEAMVSSSTFYRYFHDKYEILTYGYRMVLEELGQDQYKSLEEFFFVMYQSAWKYRDMMKHLFKKLGIEVMTEFLCQMNGQAIRQIVEENLNHALTETEQLQCSILTIGVSQNVLGWHRGEFKLSPEEMTTATMELVPESWK